MRRFSHTAILWGITAAAAGLVAGAVPTGADEDGAASSDAAPAMAQAHPDSVRKYRFLGKTARDKKDHDAAIGYYTQLLRFRPEDHLPHYYIGRAHLAMGRPAPAKQALLAASERDSSHTNTLLSLYQIYVSEGVPDSAWQFLAPVYGTRSDEGRYLDYRRAIADLHRRNGEAARAIEHYTALAAAQALPEAARAELYELLAVMHDDRGEAAAALAWRQRLAGAGGATQVESLTRMVDLHLQTEDYDGAHRILQQLALIDSGGRIAHYTRMAELGRSAGNRAVRLEGLQGLARLQPKDETTIATIAEIHLQAEDLTAAADWIERGLRSSPDSAHLRVLHGDLLNRAGAEERALAEYERALADANWAAVAQQRIWQIRPPETEEEKLRRQFFGSDDEDGDT